MLPKCQHRNMLPIRQHLFCLMSHNQHHPTSLSPHLPITPSPPPASPLPPSSHPHISPSSPHLRHSAFLPAASPSPHPSDPDDAPATREPVQIHVIGSKSGIDVIIQTLHMRGFAHINEWSALVPHTSGKLMRVLTRWVQTSLKA